MESKANYAFVGLVVILLTVGIISAVLWLSTRGGSNHMTTYTVYFRDQTLDGLQVDSNVTMKGIKVGTVANFKISSRNIETVRVVLRLDASTPVKTDTHAVIRRNLLTGLAYIDLTESSQKSALLTEAPEGEEYPVIPEGKSELRAITDSVPNLLDKSGVLMDSVTAFFSKDNQMMVSNIIADVARVAHVFGEREKTFDGLIADSAKAAHDLRDVSAALAKATAEGKVEGLSEDLRKAASQIASVVENVNTKIELISQTFMRSADSIVHSTSSLSSELSRAARDLSAAVERFDEPRAALLGPAGSALGPGEVLQKKEERR